MSYSVNRKTLLFEALTEGEAHQLYVLGYRIVMDGHVDMGHPAFLAWAEAAEYDERQKLLVYVTAFPQRLLVSVCRYHELGFAYRPARSSETIGE
jgi:hypothetical protein